LVRSLFIVFFGNLGRANLFAVFPYVYRIVGRMSFNRRYYKALGLGLIFASCSGGPWPSADQEKFRDECGAEGGTGRYCDCYLDKVMERYPNVSDAEKMDFETAVELASECKE
jgi:hypothetical protein